MTDNQNPNPNPPANSSVSAEPGHNGNHRYPNPPEIGYGGGGHKHRYPNPPETGNPDPVTLREQWRFATRQYSRWYSQAWGSAILAGLAFFALGWVIKGSNPLPSFVKHEDEHKQKNQNHEDAHETPKS